jgi:hypothetical protein
MNPSLTPAPGGSPRSESSPSAAPCAVEHEGTGLPFFGTWRGVYLFVFGSFLVWVVLLAWLTRFFA